MPSASTSNNSLLETMKTDERLYEAIWKTAGKKVGYGIDCDVLTDQLIDVIQWWLDTKTTEEAE